MATLTITTTTAQDQRIAAAVRGVLHYQDEIPDPNDPETMIPNPESIVEFFKRKMIEHIKNLVKQHEANIAADSARTSAISTVDADFDSVN